MTSVAAARDIVALRRLVRLRPARREAALQRLLRQQHLATRGAAVRVGAMLLPPERLVAWLRDGSDPVLRNAGLAMLEARGAASRPVARALLQDDDADVVRQAIQLVERLHDRRAVPSLRRLLRHAHANVVQAAVLALGQVGDAAVAADLIPLLQGDHWLAVAAAQALGAMRSVDALAPLSAALADELLRPVAARALAQIGGAEAFRALAACWLAHPDEGELLECCVTTAEEAAPTPPIVPGLYRALTGALRGDVHAARVEAARALLLFGPTDADAEALDVLATSCPSVSPLPACLRERPDRINGLLRAGGVARGWGLRLAARHPASTSTAGLAEVLVHLRGYEYTDELIAALEAVGDEILAPEILRLYGRLPRTLRLRWTPVLRRHVDALRVALQANDPAVPEWVRTVLAPILASSTALALATVCAAPVEIRVEALAHIADREAVLRRLPWPAWLECAPHLFGAFAVSVAAEARLADHAPALRALVKQRPHRELVRLLGRLRDEASAPLLESLALGGPLAVRPFAFSALGEIGGPAGRRALRRAIRQLTLRSESGDWRRLALRSLAACHTPEDLPLFRRAARLNDWYVRRTAAAVLAAAGRPQDTAILRVLAADPRADIAAHARAGAAS